MRIERSHPWGFDDGDPRLDIRRAAAEAEREIDAAETPDADDQPPDDSWSNDAEEWEFAGAASGQGNSTAISRR
jgi:hypothetical protein